MADRIWRQERGEGPLVAIALHDGHDLRPEVRSHLALDEAARLREEDPFTGAWTSIAPTRLVGLRSRFEVDLNRPREGAVYRTPADAWGLELWTDPLPDDVAARSLAEYDLFYEAAAELLGDLERRHGRFFVYDLHSYNHRRLGPEGPAADAGENPQVNIGTGSLDRRRWGPLVDGLIDDLRSFDYPGARLDVRENVRFRGGNFSRWVHGRFPTSGCVVAIEFKKFFMDEWTGMPEETHLESIRQALASTVPGVLKRLDHR